VSALLAAAAVAVLLWTPESRLDRIRRGQPPSPVGVPVVGAVLLAAIALGVLLPLPWGPVVAAGVARGLLHAVRRLSPPPTTPPLADVALGLEVAAAVIAAGSPVPAGLAAAGDALVGGVGDAFTRAAQAARVGGDPAEALRDALPGLPGSAVGVIRRSGLTGASVTGPLSQAAADLRSAAAHEAESRVQSAAVRLVLPIGLCFLPAFVLVGVVPVVAGLAGGLW
jgi:Flp pilus assembly protein TadB